MKNTLHTATLAALVGLTGCAFDGDSLERQGGALVSVLGGEQCVTLYAGQSIDAGTVCLSVSGDDLVVTYETTGDWGLLEAHLWIGTSLADMPQTNTGNPQLGLFPYKAEDLGDATSVSFHVPIESLGGEPAVCDQSFYVVAHAALRRPDGEGGFQTETGFGDGDLINEYGSWATYFDVTLTCDDVPPPPDDECECETAFAEGDTTFVELGLTKNRWGWQLTVDEGAFSAPLYAGAAHNDPSRGIHVGTVHVENDGEVVTVSYETFPGFHLEEIHVYAGCTDVGTIAPGQFGHGAELSNATTYTASFELGCAPAYVVAHAVACH
jgi:hypothetical protein